MGLAKEEEEVVDFNAEIVSSFASYAAEGDGLAKQGKFLKAIEAYTKALVLRPEDKNALVARSKCFLQLGDSPAALIDADASLVADSDFFKGIFTKAEALYAQGDFELSLVYYHRGNKCRPELDEFRLGIQKASEAIDNSIGNPMDYKFEPPPGARLVVSAPPTNPTPKGAAADISFLSGVWKVTAPNEKQKDVKVSNSVKKLLGELYTDMEYLEDFVNDKDFSTNPNKNVKVLVEDALKYLDTRTEFWRQQRPLYSRKRQLIRTPVKRVLHSPSAPKGDASQEIINDRSRSKSIAKQIGNHSSFKKNVAGSTPKIPKEKQKTLNASHKIIKLSSQQIVNTGLSIINYSLENNDYNTALRKTKALISKLGEKELGDLSRLQADLYDIQASIHLKLGSISEAIAMFKKEAEIATSSNFLDCIIRSHTEMGKLYIRLHKEARAVHSFEVVLSLSNESRTIGMATILFLMAGANFNLKNYQSTVTQGQKAIDIAKDLLHIEVNASTIVRQAQVLMKECSKL